MLWPLAYSEIFFEKKLWPDFNEKDYYKIKDFSLENIKYLRIKLEIEKEEEFIKNVMKAYD